MEGNKVRAQTCRLFIFSFPSQVLMLIFFYKIRNLHLYFSFGKPYFFEVILLCVFLLVASYKDFVGLS